MATEDLDRQASHRRSITVTSVAAFAGVIAGIVSAQFAQSATDRLGFFIFVTFTILAFGVMYGLGIDVEDFSTKDYLFVGFMSFSMWYVTWGILLTELL
ncbi:MAG: hypothetical protein ABEI06_08040 [Halobacteriaceae archaeon]